MANTNMEGGASSVSQSDKTMAGNIMLGAVGLLVLFGLIAAVMGGFIFALIYFALAGAAGYLGYMKMREGNLQVAKMSSLIVGAIVLLLGLLVLANLATAWGGLGFLLALLVLAAGAGLVYAAMLVSPGRKLF